MLRWNMLDLALVTIWLVFRVLTIESGHPRLLRVLHWIRMLDSLFLLIKSIEASMSILLWSLVLLIFVMMVLAMMIGQSLTPFMRNEEADESSRQLVYEKWGTFLRALTTMFAIPLANWAPIC